MSHSRDVRIAVAAVGIGLTAMAIDHLVGTESEPGEDDSFPVDPAAFLVSAVVIVLVAAALFELVVRRAEGDDPRRTARKGLTCSVLAVLTVPLLFLGLPFPLAGAGIALGLRSRDAAGGRLATAAAALGALVLALAVVAYTVALVS